MSDESEEKIFKLIQMYYYYYNTSHSKYCRKSVFQIILFTYCNTFNPHFLDIKTRAASRINNIFVFKKQN